MKKLILIGVTLALTSFLVFFNPSYTYTFSSQPPAGRTGAPGETSCAASGCHPTGSLVTGSSDITFDNPLNQLANGYVPGQQYNLTVGVSSAARYGFQITCLDGSNNMAGAFSITNATSTSLQTSGGREYVNHLNAGSTAAWAFRWTAPATDIGPVTFYVAANKSDFDGSTVGDVIHLASFTRSSASANCGSVSVAITDGSGGTPTGICAGSPTTLSADGISTTAPVTYAWSTGATTQTISATTAGTYSVTIQDDNTCTATTSITLSTPAAPVAGFSSTSSALDASFSNLSTSASTYAWSFGDGGTSTMSDPTHSYAGAGTYDVELIATNSCGESDTASERITITATGILDVRPNDVAVSVFPNPANNLVTFNVEGQNEDYQLFVYDLVGKRVKQIMGIGGESLILDLSNVKNGIYIFNIMFDDGRATTGRLMVQ